MLPSCKRYATQTLSISYHNHPVRTGRSGGVREYVAVAQSLFSNYGIIKRKPQPESHVAVVARPFEFIQGLANEKASRTNDEGQGLSRLEPLVAISSNCVSWFSFSAVMNNCGFSSSISGGICRLMCGCIRNGRFTSTVALRSESRQQYGEQWQVSRDRSLPCSSYRTAVHILSLLTRG